ncbi:MAG: Fe-S cluster assembly sulfur transfer protein SufU [Bacteroidota bacterium]
MNEQLKALYKSVILKHDKTPFHYEKKEQATHVIKAYNELCGDRFDIYFEIEDDTIKDIFFHGYGCAISKASTSVLIKKIIDRPIAEAKKTIELFLENITGEKDFSEITDDELTAFSAAKNFPGRKKCATLAWEEMQRFMSYGNGMYNTKQGVR